METWIRMDFDFGDGDGRVEITPTPLSFLNARRLKR